MFTFNMELQPLDFNKSLANRLIDFSHFCRFLLSSLTTKQIHEGCTKRMVKLRQRLWPSVNNLSLVEFNSNLSPIQTTLNNQNIKTIFFFNLSITFKEVALPGNFFFLNGYMCIRKFFYYRFLFAHMDCSSFFFENLQCKVSHMQTQCNENIFILWSQNRFNSKDLANSLIKAY